MRLVGRLLGLPRPNPWPRLGAPGYGLPNNYRWQVVGAAQLFGVAYACEAYNVSDRSVRRWLELAKEDRNV